MQKHITFQQESVKSFSCKEFPMNSFQLHKELHCKEFPFNGLLCKISEIDDAADVTPP